MTGRVVSPRFPYVPLALTVRGRTAIIEALLDTGFDGDVALPRSFVATSARPDSEGLWALADGSPVRVAVFAGTAQIGDLQPAEVAIIVIGDEPLVGRGMTDHFTIILDHGRRLIVEL